MSNWPALKILCGALVVIMFFLMMNDLRGRIEKLEAAQQQQRQGMRR